MKLPEGWIEAQRNPDLHAAEQAVVEAERQIKEVAAIVRKSCAHSTVAEAPYYHSNYGSSMPPFRVCVVCGFQERGWGCGYHALADAANRMVINMERHQAACLATEPQRVSGWWIIPAGRTDARDPYKGYPEDE